MLLGEGSRLISPSPLLIAPFSLQRTEELLRQECNFFDVVEDEKQGGLGGDSGVSSVLSAYKSEGDPAKYEDAFRALHAFIERSLDAYKVT